MLGAIIGDIVGSRWEFDPTNDYDFEWLSEENGYTDDTICTIAVADALLNERDFGESIHDWCNRYPDPMGGYGGRFAQWVHSENPQPYNSFGNGAAMRVSPVAHWYDTLDEVLDAAAATALPTHNHDEGIKGAQTVAMAIFRGVQYNGRYYQSAPLHIDEILQECVDFSGYDINMPKASVMNRFDETCQGTVPLCDITDFFMFMKKQRLMKAILASLMLFATLGMSAQEQEGFKKINVKEDFTENGFQWFSDAQLLCAGNKEKSNAMTIGWGGIGTLWGRSALTVYVAEARYTKLFMDNSEYFTVMSFDVKDSKVLTYMGTKSGRDGDKAKALGLHTAYTANGTPYYTEATMVIECKKMYAAPIDSQYFKSDVPKDKYRVAPAGIHTMYIGEVVNAWSK